MQATFGGEGNYAGLVSRGKTSLFSVHFDAKQCRDRFQQPHPCDPSPVLCSVTFCSNFVLSLLLDLNPYGGNDPDVMFPLFLISILIYGVFTN